MTEDWSGHNPTVGTGWANTEYRTFEFLPVDTTAKKPLYSIREIEWSRIRRGLSGEVQKPLRHTGLREFKETVVDGEQDVLLN